MIDAKRGEERIMRVTEIDGERTSWVDEGELVRCADCFYWRDDDFCVNPQWQGRRTANGLIEFPCAFAEDFCSYAERKEATDGR